MTATQTTNTWGTSHDVLNADWRDVIDDLNYDLIITDAPYGIGIDYGDGFSDTQDELATLARDLAPYLGRAAVFTGVANMHWWPPPVWTLCWATPAGQGSGPYGFCCWQPILVYGPDPKLQDGAGRHPDSYFQTENMKASDPRHPVAKPLSVMRWLIERISRPGETILDPFAGSGTTAVAAREAGRHSVMIERNPDFCDVITDRLKHSPLEYQWD